MVDSTVSSPGFLVACPWFSGLHNLNPFHLPSSPLLTCLSGPAVLSPICIKCSVPSSCWESPLPIQFLPIAPDSALSVCLFVLDSLGEGHFLDQESANFFSTWSDGKYFQLLDHRVSVAASQLCHCTVKAATDSTSVSDCVARKLYLQKYVMRWTLLMGLEHNP